MIVPGFLLDLIYLILIAAISPVLLYQSVRQGKYREGWGNKLWGQLPVRTSGSGWRVWIHAVSVGEVLQLQQVIRELRMQVEDVDILVTTTTQTGFQVAREKLKDCQIAYFPLDFTWSVRRSLQRVSPDLIILVELEIWPNFLKAASRRDIPVLLINGRLSAKSFRGYLKLRPLFAPLLNRIKRIAVQSEEYAERFLAVGCDPGLISVTGSIKFDGVQTERSRPPVEKLRQFFQLRAEDIVLIAGSTQSPEEEMVLCTFEKVRQEFPRARLIIVPRHPERGTEISRLIEKRGQSQIRRTTGPSGGAPYPPVGLLDTVGELNDCWALADIAFVGGSFGDRGGQNMLEPAAYGAAVCFGPNTRNFRHIVELLQQQNAAQTVHSQEDLDEFVLRMFREREAAQEMGRRAQQLVLAQQGATKRTVNLIIQVLEQSEAALK